MDCKKPWREFLSRFFRSEPALSAAVRNFLLCVEADGGFWLENDERLRRWAVEADEAEQQGLFVADGGHSAGYRLTLKAERRLRAFRFNSPATSLLLGSSIASVQAGLTWARRADAPE